MDGFSVNGAAGDTKTALMNQVKQEAAINNAKQLIEKINNHCFTACIPKPGSSLSGTEAQCLSNCMDKYMKAWDTVNRTYVARAQAEVSRGNAGGLM